MKKLNHWVATASVGFVLTLGGMTAQSQQSTNQSSRGPDWQNMDGQQIQQFFQRRMNEMFRERLEVTDDAEWKIVEERLGKVTQARWATIAEGTGMMGMGNELWAGRAGPGRGRSWWRSRIRRHVWPTQCRNPSAATGH